MPVTTQIATESKRATLTQTIQDLYNSLHVGGAYDAKKDVVTTGVHNEITDGLQERTHTIAGFKTKMLEQASEFIMVTQGKETTRMLTSVYGHHSTERYGARFGNG
jgi:hypothetical protein